MNAKNFKRAMVALGAAGLLLLAYVACSTYVVQTKRTTLGPGYIRSVEIHNEGSWDVKTTDLILEEDSGNIQKLSLIGQPPVWKGMHCVMEISEWDGDGRWQLDNIRRVGPDAKP